MNKTLDINNVIDKIYSEVKNRCMLPSNAYGIGAWEHHIKLVYEIATTTYKEYNANYNIVAIAALLHDLASITNKDYTEEHHVIGADIAEEILLEYNLDSDIIDRIKKCILNHRGSRITKRNTPEEICIADADAMAHFYSVSSLFSMVYKEKQLSIDEGQDFVYQKLLRSYNKLSPKGKEIIKPYYDAIKVLFSKK